VSSGRIIRILKSVNHRKTGKTAMALTWYRTDNIIQKTGDRATRTPLKTEDELMSSAITKPVICHEWGKDGKF
jgi:hypothetical protein